MDNGGSRSTGNIRATGQVSLKGFWQRGDLTTVQLTKSEGLNSGRVSYSEPLGGSGLRGGVFASVSRYQLALPEFSAIRAHGPSNSLGLELMYPWLRTATSSINATASLERKRFTNHANEVVASDYHSDVLTAGLNGQFQDPLQGSNSLSYQLSIGYLNLTGSPNEMSDARGAQTAGMFNKIRAQWIRQQKISDVDVFQFNWQGQWASKNLDGSEKIFLGGPQGVRAYPVNEGGASAGHVLNLEWFRQVQWEDQQPLTLSVFKDLGYATVNKYTWSADSLNKYALRGHGLSVGTAFNTGSGQSQLKFTWAKRLGLNPVANSTTGLDQDGTLSINRFWLTLSHFL
jgi:hemolysin activation/secretion protein